MTFITNTDIDIDLVHYLGPIFWGKFNLTPLLETRALIRSIKVLLLEQCELSHRYLQYRRDPDYILPKAARYFNRSGFYLLLCLRRRGL